MRKKSKMSLEYKIDTKNDLQIARLKGKLIEPTQAEEFMEWVGSCIEDSKLNFIFDLSAMDYVNSIGINMFIRMFTKVRNKGGEIIFINIPEKINQLLVITKLNTIFTIASSEEDAIQQLKA